MTVSIKTQGSSAQFQLEAIEQICATDVGRNIAPLADASMGDFGHAVASISQTPSANVVIVTGFFIPDATPPAPETDGLTGSTQLAAGLINSGISAHILTDSPCSAAIRAAAQVVDVQIPIMTCGTTSKEVMSVRNRLLELTPPVSHLLSIERLGPNAGGRLLGQFGFDFSPYMAPFHMLFEGEYRLPQCITIGAGDGGNEIGMGKIPKELLNKYIAHGSNIHCSTKTDYLLVCGVSNWAGPAVLCGLAVLRPDMADDLLRFLTESVDHRMLHECVYQGPAVDGSPERIQMSIDGLAWEYHWSIISRMRSVAISGLEAKS